MCPVFKEDRRESLTARGRLHLLQRASANRFSAVFEHLFSCCLLCTACEQVCPRKLPITHLIVEARNQFSFLYGPNSLQKNVVGSILRHPALLERLTQAGLSLHRIRRLPSNSGLRLKLALLEERPAKITLPDEKKEWPRAGISYFTGCFARHHQPPE
ncbi:MAG: (Fe-S)-binding protein, partial [Candidatus Electrothrix sp. AR3]|nr:(Fe-S)-binding protein [Candidatus Electrothrix sp. AR3]